MSESASNELWVESTVGAAAVAPSVLALSRLNRVDYADHFAIGPIGVPAVTPEEWARVMFGDIPSVSERFIWQWLLQLRLYRGSARLLIAGWVIADRGDDWIRLEANSWALAANLIVRASDSRVSLTTALRYDRRFGTVVWRALSVVHRRLAPELLRDAVARVVEASADDWGRGAT